MYIYIYILNKESTRGSVVYASDKEDNSEAGSINVIKIV